MPRDFVAQWQLRRMRIWPWRASNANRTMRLPCLPRIRVRRRHRHYGFQRTFDEMELSLDLASEKCPHCGAVNLFPGFSQMFVFTCKQCGETVKIVDGPG